LASLFTALARTILIEVNVAQGTRFFMSGLPDNALKESQLRIESALKHCRYFMPRKRTTSGNSGQLS
jgi:magnesium chelatase family protein